MDKKISVLIPMFNREKYVKDSVVSILKQTYQNFEIIVYDDGSTDKSVSIVKELANRDKRIQLIEGKENRGVGYARNVLLDSCRTELACWQDSDDLANIHRLEEQVKFNRKTPLVLAGYYIFRDARGIDIMQDPRPYTGKGSARASILFPVDTSVRFIERKILGGEDIAWYRCMVQQHSVSTVPKILYYVRFHSNRIGWIKWQSRKLSKKSLQGKTYKEISEMILQNRGR